MALIKLPGLIDIHVHLRDPGQTHKEDFYTGTCAALAGGFTTIFDMPNNSPQPIVSEETLANKIAEAKRKTVCDLGFYFGSLGDVSEFPKVKDKVWGIKIYLNHTTGNYLVGQDVLRKVYENWPEDRMILTHSEEDTIVSVIAMVEEFKKRTHICHVSSEHELSLIMAAKEKGLPITCGVCMHHLTLSEESVAELKGYGIMKPPLKKESDKEFLWNHIKDLDVIESDHAPHAKSEKEGENPMFGVPGLETTLPLLLTSVAQGKVTMDDITKLCYSEPKKIFGIPDQDDTYVLVDTGKTYKLTREMLKTKCGWSPFLGWEFTGGVVETVYRGKTVFKDGEILTQPGSGFVVYPEKS